jgi:hypothetical protein
MPNFFIVRIFAKVKPQLWPEAFRVDIFTKEPLPQGSFNVNWAYLTLIFLAFGYIPGLLSAMKFSKL